MPPIAYCLYGVRYCRPPIVRFQLPLFHSRLMCAEGCGNGYRSLLPARRCCCSPCQSSPPTFVAKLIASITPVAQGHSRPLLASFLPIFSSSFLSISPFIYIPCTGHHTTLGHPSLHLNPSTDSHESYRAWLQSCKDMASHTRVYIYMYKCIIYIIREDYF